MAALGEIFVVDDDAAVRDALALVLSLEGYHVRVFSDGNAFLATARARVPACVILDVHMPGRSGLDILRELEADRYPAPVFIISGQGDIPMAVDAIRHGALDFIEKPFDAETVVERVRDAIEARERRAAASNEVLGQHFPGHDQLTPREREVLEQITRGASNKEAGRVLGISPRTIEVHRARIMEKLGAKNAADLVRIVLKDIRI
ncbi:response regulator [Bosea sp. 117]|uniref:response regulator transcription factor n=1 Tax=Bosea sp. 117 TaxID=1125973 RepID=UPI0004948442|nr:response regulator [Bosea sp. 117]